jgi:hypothetical protein
MHSYTKGVYFVMNSIKILLMFTLLYTKRLFYMNCDKSCCFEDDLLVGRRLEYTEGFIQHQASTDVVYWLIWLIVYKMNVVDCKIKRLHGHAGW